MSKICLNPACKNPHNPDDNQFCHGCSANLAESTQSYLFENYRVTKLLGEGGFGRTYLAEYLRRYNEPRLIKTLITSEHKQTQQKIKELFTREAEQLYRLDHPQIPKLYEYFEKDNNLYLVQEFIDGINLREELEQDGLFPAQKIQTILEKLLPVLVYIEEQNLLHRDIKPDNIMRRHSDGVLMLIDFGAARVKTGIGPTVFTAIYTPGYAAIEHMRGRPVKASDVYSLGVTCIRLLTGCLPTGTTDLIYDDHENCLCWKEYLQERNIKVSERLVAILDQMVASSLKDRYPDAQAVLKDLLLPISPPVSLPTELEQDLLLSISSPVSLPTGLENGQNSTVPPTFSVPSRTLVKSPKRFGLLAGVVAILSGVVGIGGYLLINQPEKISHNNPDIDHNSQESIDKNDIIPLLESLEAQYQQGNYQDCYQSATDNPNQDNSVLQEWMGKCGLEAAKIKANANSYSAAIAIAQTIPDTVPNYQEVKDSINTWSGKILEYATKVYQEGKLEDAIKLTDIIPDNSSAKTKIPNLISQWEQEQEQAHRQVSLISKTTGVDYNRLRDLLEAGNWKEADRETTRIMLQAAGREKEGWFRREDIKKFSCEDLRIIDQLWLESSQGKFGFSVQKEIWQRNGRPTHARGKQNESWRKFEIEIGWYKIEEGRVGNLPSDIYNEEQNLGIWGVTLDDFFSRAANCNL